MTERINALGKFEKNLTGNIVNGNEQPKICSLQQKNTGIQWFT